MQPLHLDVDAITATCLSLLGIALLANAGLLVLLAGLRRVFASAPCLLQEPPTPRDADATSLTVVIPAFNEEDNIVRSLSSVLRSEPRQTTGASSWLTTTPATPPPPSPSP